MASGMTTPLRILTLNVCGLADPDKRSRLFFLLRSWQVDICCLQELRTSPGSYVPWSLEWGGPASWNKHTAILFRRPLGCVTFTDLYEGRVLSATFNHRGRLYKLANLYLPSNKTTRLRFLDTLTAQHSLTFSSYDFLVGDWNMYPDVTRDRTAIPDSYSRSASFSTWPHITTFLASFFDAAFLGNSSTPYFTYFCRHTRMQSRIDHIYAHNSHSSLLLSTVVNPFSKSDHSAVIVTFSDPSSRSHLLHRLNTRYLSSDSLHNSTVPLLTPYRDPLYWDATKHIARSHAQDFGYLMSSQRHSRIRFHERQLAQARRQAAANMSVDSFALTVLECRERLDAEVTDATSRAQLRARVRWLEEGETCSSYFFSRFRSQRSQSTLSQLRDSAGQPFPSAAARRCYVAQYYTGVYAAPSFDSSVCHSFLDTVSLPSLSADQFSALLSPFTAEEMAATIRQLPLRRSPGPDGLPYEWYQTFADTLIPILLPLFNAVLLGAPPPPSWSQTLISLIPKPDRDLTSLSNWRPITLSNCDVKIYSRMLTSRLALVLPDLVAPNQAGFVKGRQAADVAMVLRSILAHASGYPVDGALVFLDQEKAYDRISHDYLSAVLDRFGFPTQLQHAIAATYANTSTYLLDDGQPVGPVSVACGVRQGDPLAPLLFNLAFEPCLAAMRSRLHGISLPWGVYQDSAFADDSAYGLGPTDGSPFLQTLHEYCNASNARINYNKSVFFPLSTIAPIPSWVAHTGLRVHNPLHPLRVLGYDLVMSPLGVQEDWNALYSKCEQVSRSIIARHVTLQGRALLTTSLLSSKLWYKCRLSWPDDTVLKRFTKLAWSTVWNDHPALAPAQLIGRRPRRQGGVNFLAPDAQIPALHAQWIQHYFTRSALWTPILDYYLSQFNEKKMLLTAYIPLGKRRSFPDSWRFAVDAWADLRPHWNTDILSWSPSEAMGYPLPKSRSVRFPLGVTLSQVLTTDPVTSRPTLMSETQAVAAFARAAPDKVRKAILKNCVNPTALGHQLLPLLLLLPSSFPFSPHPIPFTTQLIVADVPLGSLTTASARRFMDVKAKVPTALKWEDRAIARLASPPEDIWGRLWRGPSLPAQRQTWYKLLLGALPLGVRITRFAPADKNCPFCPNTVQTLRHFVSTCPLAQQVWREFATIFDLPSPPSLHHCLYSWPSSPSSFLGRAYGYRLQAGHAVALHLLWVLVIQARFHGNRATPASIPARLRFFLRRHLVTLSRSSRWGRFFPSLPATL
jgi:exonuclease III